jgi:RNA polymerase sigma factor (sigma-70 family)
MGSSSSIALVLTPTEVSALVRAAASGDRESWNRLVDTFAGLVWSVIRGHRFFGAEAADISQTVWLKTVENLHRVREPERFAAWIATTARHECYRLTRKAGRSVSMADVPEVETADHGQEVIAAAILQEDRAVVARALELVPPKCQVLLRMLCAEPPLTYDDISEALDMPKGSIGPTRSRCLAHLKHQLERENLT